MVRIETARPFGRVRSGRRAFALHLGEMLIAMLLGMVVLGGAIEGALALFGASLSDAPTSLAAAVMAINMTVPMVWWMRHRGHPVQHNAEMAGSMVIPTANSLARARAVPLAA
jgi:fatty acid desaturase